MTTNATRVPFQAGYARYYDILYNEKDYGRECDFLEAVFSRFGIGTPSVILDMGCGTGGHAIPLAKRGYVVAGVDASEAMLAVAREKAKRENLSVSFRLSRMENLRLNGTFDAIISIFNVLDYLTSDEALEAALGRIHHHLRRGGLFVFDYRNGIAAIRSSSPVRLKWVRDGHQKLLRISETTVDSMRHLVHTIYTVLVFNGERVIEEFRDEHVLRFFFPREVERFVETAGFHILHTCSFPELDRPAREDVWNVAVVARRL